MVHKNYSSTVGLTLLLTATTVVDVQWVRAQSPAFQLPASVAQGTNVRIDGSSSMAAVNRVLKQRFEQQFPGTKVSLAANGASAGIQSVLNGKADIAAIARPLTEAEKAQGLKSAPIGRDKIAIIVGANNPFAKSITINQFARIFRGEVRNWSQVGGQNTPIKFVDRPDGSDTRQAFRSYPAFKQGKFTTGTTALKLKQDTIQAVAANLGNNGMSYATANQLKNQPGVRAIALDGVKPTDARYPFSQPLYYIYKDGATPAVQAFLGLATNAPGQSAIEKAGVADTAQKPAGTAATPGGASPNSSGDGNPLAFLFPGENTAGTAPDTGLPHWLWWLLPIASGAALLWMLARGRRRSAATRDHAYFSDRDRNETGAFTPPPYPSDPDAASVNNAPYVEGGFDPLYTANGMSAPPLGETPPREPSNFDFEPKDTIDRGFGHLSADTLALGTGATWSAFGNRPNQSRVVLKTRSSQEVEAFWDIPNDERQAARQHGAEKLALRLYDVTEIDLAHQPAHSVQQFDCDELTQRQRLPIGLPDRDYLVELGYLTSYNQWLSLARSTHVRVPPANPFSSARSSTVVASDAIAPDAVDSVKPVLSNDRDIDSVEIENAPIEPPTEAPQVPAESESWFQQMTDRVADTASNLTQAGGAAAAGAGTAAWSFISGQRQADPPQTAPATEAASFTTETVTDTAPSNSSVTGETIAPSMQPRVNEGRLVLTPRNSRWAYATWDLPRSLRSRINLSDGANLVLRLYDVTENGTSLPERYEQLDIDDMALSCDVPIPVSDRTYIAEVGYVDTDQQWTRLARSTPAHIPAN